MFRKTFLRNTFIYFFIGLFVYLPAGRQGSFILPKAFAQEAAPNFDVTISPHFFDINAKPGDTVKNKIMLRNNSDSPLQLKMGIKKLLVDSRGETIIQDIANTDDAYSFIHIASSGAKFTAQAKEWTTLPFSITIPKDANFGYDWVLFISPQNTIATAGVGAKVNGSVAVPLLIDVNKDNAIVDGTIANFTTNQNWYEFPPVNFLLTFSSRSNIHIKPTGNIFITDWTGQQVATVGINPALGAILPKSQRTFTSTWDNGFITLEDKTEDGNVLLDKNGKPQKKWNIRFDKILDFRIGKYTAHALVVVSGPKKDYSYETATNFFIFPWKIVIGTLVVIIFLLIGIISTTKSLGVKIVSVVRRVFGKKQ